MEDIFNTTFLWTKPKTNILRIGARLEKHPFLTHIKRFLFAHQSWVSCWLARRLIAISQIISKETNFWKLDFPWAQGCLHLWADVYGKTTLKITFGRYIILHSDAGGEKTLIWTIGKPLRSEKLICMDNNINATLNIHTYHHKGANIKLCMAWQAFISYFFQRSDLLFFDVEQCQWMKYLSPCALIL